jgi:uncharacterized C2H2 Zn-finger protein
MPIEQIVWAFALLLAALGIAFLNDKMKKKGSKSQTKPKSPESKWGLLVGVALVIAITTLGLVCGPEAAYLRWVVPLVLVVLVLLALIVASRKAIWLLLKSLLTHESLPTFLWKTKSGSMLMRCPRCKTRVESTTGHEGELIFHCANCGETATVTPEVKQ